ncbi:MAG: hypothetical protein HUU55_24030, partial [Myxococcales bacterium]|nr:hypothetical protein [Myxococcales bacterium]
MLNKRAANDAALVQRKNDEGTHWAMEISYQTSRSLNDRLFRTMDNVAISSAGITQTIVRQATATNPLH